MNHVLVGLSTLDWLDILIIIFLALAIITGFSRGFVRQAFNLVGLYVGLILASQFHGVLATWLHAGFPNASLPLLSAATFVAMLVLIAGIGNYLGRLAYPVTRLLMLGPVDRVAGALLSLLLALAEVALALLVLRFVISVPLVSRYAPMAALSEYYEHSYIKGPLFTYVTPALGAMVQIWLPGNLLPPIWRS